MWKEKKREKKKKSFVYHVIQRANFTYGKHKVPGVILLG